MISVRVKSNIPALISALKKCCQDGVDSGGKQMTEVAKEIESPHDLSGDLNRSIRYEQDNKKVGGRVVADGGIQAFTLEFGTGTFSTYEGVTHRTPPWYVHADDVPYDLTELYGWGTVASKKGEFYEIPGARPHPYMKPAFDATEDYTKQEVINQVVSKCEELKV